MKKTAVLVFTTSYRPFIGGAEVAIQEVSQRLKREFDFLIITSRFRRDLPREEIFPEGRVVRVGLGRSVDKLLILLWGAAEAFRQAKKFKKEGRGVILWGMDISQGSLAAAFFKFLFPKIPFILTVQYGLGEERLKHGKMGIIGKAFKFMLSRADSVTAISTYLMKVTQEFGYRGETLVIHNGVDGERFSAAESVRHSVNTVITTSRLVPKNGIDILIRAIAEVKKEIPGIKCLIAGDGPEKQKLASLAGELGVGSEVKFLGSMPFAEIPKLLQEANLFVRPSRSEGLGNSFVEALAAGLPIIGTSVGGITDIIKDRETGIFTRVEDSHDLAEKIKMLLKNSKLAQSIAEQGKQMVADKFSWDKIATSYQNVFKKVGYGSGLKIIVATPLYPPQLGGPALYAKNLAEEFEKKGHKVKVVPFTPFLRYPGLVRHFLYFGALLKASRKSDILFGLDQFSVGAPAVLVSLILKKPLVLRLEGDFLWEKFVERTRRDITLPAFYREPQLLSFKERLAGKINGWVIKRADKIIFSSEWRRNMILNNFKIRSRKTAIIQNTWPGRISNPPVAANNSRVILWAGRMLYLKNLYRLMRAFRKVNPGDYELHLVGEGPERGPLEDFIKKEKIPGVIFRPTVPHEELLKKFSASSFFVLPSLSEVGPNVIADAVSTNTPFIMTRETGFVEYVGQVGLLLDPLSEDDIAAKIKILMDENALNFYREKLREFSLKRDWSEVAEEWLGLFEEVLGVN